MQVRREGFPRQRVATGPVTWCGITHRAYNRVVQNERAPSGRVNDLRWWLTEADRHGIIEILRTRQRMAERKADGHSEGPQRPEA